MERRTPEIRFKGFTEKWQKKTISQLGIVITGSTPPTNIEAYYSKNGVPFVTPTDISELITFHTEKYLSAKGEAVARIVPKNTILVTCLASIGKNTILGTEGSFNQQINGLIPNDKETSPYFLLVLSIIWSRIMKSSASSGIMQIVSKSEFSKLETFIPNIAEQTKIGDFFKNIDNLIAVNQRKHEKLLNIKKAFLEKMFPNGEADTPEIRFKGFTEKWQKKKYQEIAEVSRGLIFKPEDICNDGVRVLRSSNILDDTFIEKEDDIFVNDSAVNINFAESMDILITSANGSSRLVGKHAIINNLSKRTVHGGFMLLVKAENPYFLNASMNSSWYYKFIVFYTAGGNGAIGNLSKASLDNQQIYVPSLSEQTKIGEFFKNIDNLISLRFNQVEKLKKIKKALLEKMFI